MERLNLTMTVSKWMASKSHTRSICQRFPISIFNNNKYTFTQFHSRWNRRRKKHTLISTYVSFIPKYEYNVIFIYVSLPPCHANGNKILISQNTRQNTKLNISLWQENIVFRFPLFLLKCCCSIVYCYYFWCVIGIIELNWLITYFCVCVVCTQWVSMFL